MLKGYADGGPHASGGAAADGVYNHHGGSRLILQRMVDFLGGSQFLDPKPG
jgi:hypothetical protein